MAKNKNNNSANNETPVNKTENTSIEDVINKAVENEGEPVTEEASVPVENEAVETPVGDVSTEEVKEETATINAESIEPVKEETPAPAVVKETKEERKVEAAASVVTGDKIEVVAKDLATARERFAKHGVDAKIAKDRLIIKTDNVRRVSKVASALGYKVL